MTRPPGFVTVRVSADECVVRLSGEIDLSIERQFDAMMPLVVRHSGRVVVDAGDVTFGDGTLARFLAEVIGQGSVSVRAPTRLVRDLLSVYGVVSG